MGGGFSENGTSSSEQALLFLTRNYLIPCLEVLPSMVIKESPSGTVMNCAQTSLLQVTVLTLHIP